MHRRSLLVFALILGLLTPFLVSAVPDPGPAASLDLTPAAVRYGHKQSAAGLVDAAAPCASGRAVDLMRKQAGSSTWEVLASTTSDQDGAYSFTYAPVANASYQAIVQAGPLGSVTCQEIDSPVKHGRVLAAVTLNPGRTKVPSGECVKLTMSVRPAKAGQSIRLQQRGAKSWGTLDTLTLGAGSAATTTKCFGWNGIGSPALRALWPKQDALNAPGASRPVKIRVVSADWMKTIDRLTGGRAVGVSLRAGGEVLYQRAAKVAFVPASNEKLLLSMAILDRLGPSLSVETIAAAPSVGGGVVKGNLWILGRGDPSTGKPQILALARAIARAGIRKVTGRVLGSTGYFGHDWFARGWRRDFPSDQVGLPSALTFRENHIEGRNVHDPERYAAEALTRRLKARGVKVLHRPGSGSPPGSLTEVAAIASPALSGLLEHMDQESDNFFAEVLGKLLGVAAAGQPGTIAKGARAIGAWAGTHGVQVRVYDGSGLSYADRITPAGMTKLLEYAGTRTWGATLRELLPGPWQGTMEETHHLHGVQVHAKTGTLTDISALSGWVWLTQRHTWAQFSILDRGMCSCRSKPMEDSIVRTMYKSAH